MPDSVHDDEPTYVISVAARLVQMHPQTLRYYERAGLIHPTRSGGGIRLYSLRDITRLRKISRLTDELGVNLAGVEVILRLVESLEQAQRELEKHKIQLESDYTIEHELRIVEQAPADSEPPRRAARRSSSKKAQKKQVKRTPRALGPD